jgi:pimeloyl-ACP methyl ester carboxylesterase
MAHSQHLEYLHTMTTSSPTQRNPGADQQQPKVVSIDSDRQITYAEYGPPSGVPVVFFHGTPGSRLLGTVLEPAAREHGIRLLAPDRPGYGRSTPWPGHSVRDAAEFVLPVLDDADVETVGLIAFSGGGPYALSTAAVRADRVSHVDIIAGATPPTVSEETPAIQQLLSKIATTTPAVLRGLFAGQAWLAERLDPSFVVGQYTANQSTVPDATAELVKRDFIEAFARSRCGAVTEFRNTAADWNIDHGEIHADVRLWHGTKDTNVPITDVHRLKRMIPSADLHSIDDADHLQTLLRSLPEVLVRYR